VRKEIQYRLEFAGSQWEVKLKMFIKDSDERAKQSQEQIKRIKMLMEDLKKKGLQESELHSQRERLMKE
jgi:hypothetical protein